MTKNEIGGAFFTTRAYPHLALRTRHGMAAADQPPLGALGWQGEFDYDQPEVAALRAELDASAGIAGLEVVDPSVPGFAEKAAAIFRRDGEQQPSQPRAFHEHTTLDRVLGLMIGLIWHAGFVAVKDVLDEDGLETIRGGCDSVIRKMMSHDSARIGNRGSHRYSFGSAPAHFGAFAEWNALVDPPVLIECLNAIFQSPDWWYAHGAASGGDFAMPGATEYQGLHRDTGDYLGDPSGKLDFRDMPTACITVNFPMEVKPGSKVGHSSHNGVTRHIPGTQKSREDIPSLEDEPRWMKLATTNPVPAGSVMIRDQRAWHGGTPNLVRR
jgi:hypothetical protein